LVTGAKPATTLSFACAAMAPRSAELALAHVPRREPGHPPTRRASATPLGPQLYHEVRHESPVAHPAEESARLCEFLGLPYDAVMLRFHEGRELHEPGLSAKKAWRPVTAGLGDWRSEMSAEDLERFEAAAGDLLKVLGYPRATDPSPEHRARASNVRESFELRVSTAQKRAADAAMRFHRVGRA
jgi:hypothetical protein